MNVTRVTIASFLSSAKEILTSYNFTSQSTSRLSKLFTIVIGNESADLDSIFSTIVFAYISTYFPIQKNQDSIFSNHAQDPKGFYIPLLNIPRSSLALRPELSPVLQYAALNPSDLLTLSDLPVPLPPPQQTRLILIDHNAPTGKLARAYEDCLVGCIDHHEEEGRVPFGEAKDEGLHGEPRIIDISVGSCASLVTNWSKKRGLDKILQTSLTTSNNNNDLLQANAQLARLALAPILIDTLSLKSSKTSPMDIDATLFLEHLITQYDDALSKPLKGNPTYDRADYFNLIQTAKQNLDNLSLTDILSKDYKQWTIANISESDAGSDSVSFPLSSSSYLGISAVVKPISYLLQRSNSTNKLLNTCLSFARERNLSLIALMTNYQDQKGQLQRELLVWGLDEWGSLAAQWFVQEASNQLGLKAWSNERGPLLDYSSPPLVTTIAPGESEIPNGQTNFMSNIDIGWRRCFKQQNIMHSRKQVAPLLRDAFKQTRRGLYNL